jgi:hypothetical protein
MDQQANLEDVMQQLVADREKGQNLEELMISILGSFADQESGPPPTDLTFTKEYESDSKTCDQILSCGKWFKPNVYNASEMIAFIYRFRQHYPREKTEEIWKRFQNQRSRYLQLVREVYGLLIEKDLPDLLSLEWSRLYQQSTILKILIPIPKAYRAQSLYNKLESAKKKIDEVRGYSDLGRSYRRIKRKIFG